MPDWLTIILNLIGVGTMVQLWLNNRTLKRHIIYLESEQQYITKSLTSLADKYEVRLTDSSKTIKDGLSHGNNISQEKKRTKQKRHWQK